MTTGQIIAKAIDAEADTMSKFDLPLINKKLCEIMEDHNLDRDCIIEILDGPVDPGPKFIEATKRKLVNQLIERITH
jgi:uncharacterized protein (DUF1778 family)